MSAGYHGYPRHLAHTRSRGSSGMLVLCMLPPPPPSSLSSSLSAVSSSSSEDVPMAASVADPDCPSSSSVSPMEEKGANLDEAC